MFRSSLKFCFRTLKTIMFSMKKVFLLDLYIKTDGRIAWYAAMVTTFILYFDYGRLRAPCAHRVCVLCLNSGLLQ